MSTLNCSVTVLYMIWESDLLSLFFTIGLVSQNGGWAVCMYVASWCYLLCSIFYCFGGSLASLDPPLLHLYLCLDLLTTYIMPCHNPTQFFSSTNKTKTYLQYTKGHPTSSPLFCLIKNVFNLNIKNYI